MILDTDKNELKPFFTANITKSFLLHADKNGEHFCEEKLHNGNENGEHIYVENFYGDNLNPHNINKLSCSHQDPQETQHLCFLELCLESLTGKHIKYYNAGQVSQHPSLLEGNHHVSTFPLLTKYPRIGQGFHSVKEIPYHGHSMSEVDWGDQHSCGNNLCNSGKNGEHSCGEIFHGNNIKKHIKSHHTWKLFHHPCSLHASATMKGNTQPWTEPLRR